MIGFPDVKPVFAHLPRLLHRTPPSRGHCSIRRGIVFPEQSCDLGTCLLLFRSEGCLQPHQIRTLQTPAHAQRSLSAVVSTSDASDRAVPADQARQYSAFGIALETRRPSGESDV